VAIAPCDPGTHTRGKALRQSLTTSFQPPYDGVIDEESAQVSWKPQGLSRSSVPKYAEETGRAVIILSRKTRSRSLDDAKISYHKEATTALRLSELHRSEPDGPSKYGQSCTRTA
jgi:hypothetical protein